MLQLEPTHPIHFDGLQSTVAETTLSLAFSDCLYVSLMTVFILYAVL